MGFNTPPKQVTTLLITRADMIGCLLSEFSSLYKIMSVPKFNYEQSDRGFNMPGNGLRD